MHKYGLVHDRHDGRDMRFSEVANKLQLVHLPPKIDLESLCSPVRDQNDLGCCTGFATITGFRECLLKQSTVPFVTLSPLFEYYWERVKEHTVDQDSGASIRDAMKVLAKFGAAPESDWPYDISKFKDQPTPQAIKDAHTYPIKAYHRIHTVMEIKQALSIKHPVVIGIEVWDSFESDAVAKSGIVPLPNFTTEQMLGGHALCIVGYDDTTRQFKFKNSWSTLWGQAGYGFLPYGFFAPNLGLVMDMWTGRA